MEKNKKYFLIFMWYAALVVCSADSGRKTFLGSCVMKDLCAHVCVDIRPDSRSSEPRYECTCHPGYILDSDGHSCIEAASIASSTLPPEYQNIDALENDYDSNRRLHNERNPHGNNQAKRLYGTFGNPPIYLGSGTPGASDDTQDWNQAFWMSRASSQQQQSQQQQQQQQMQQQLQQQQQAQHNDRYTNSGYSSNNPQSYGGNRHSNSRVNPTYPSQENDYGRNPHSGSHSRNRVHNSQHSYSNNVAPQALTRPRINSESNLRLYANAERMLNDAGDPKDSGQTFDNADVLTRPATNSQSNLRLYSNAGRMQSDQSDQAVNSNSYDPSESMEKALTRPPVNSESNLRLYANSPASQTETQNDTYNQNSASNMDRYRPLTNDQINRKPGNTGSGNSRYGNTGSINNPIIKYQPNHYDKTQSDAVPESAPINSVLEDEDEFKSSFYDNPKVMKSPNCDHLQCRAGGTCVADEMIGGVRCQCPLGTEGPQCERDVVVKYPKLMGFGYMAFPVLRGAYREFSITVEFRPDTHNGLLLFSSDRPDARSDFFSVALMDGHVEFRFDCGTGMAVITSDNMVELGQWNRIVIERKDFEGSVTLNDGPMNIGRSRGLFSRITFREYFYLGGYRNLSLVAERTGMAWGFVGCVRELVANDKKYDMRKGPYIGDAIHGVDVGECSSHVCDGVPCQNGGRCVADSADTSVCLCPVGVAGDRCESKLDIYVPAFDGTSFMQYLGLRRTVLMFTEIEIVFKPLDKDGLLLYNGYRTDRTGDYISLAMIDGVLEFRFDLGTGPAVIRSTQPLHLNEWHTAKLTRTGRDGKMKVDSQPEVTGIAKGSYTQLTLTLDLFLGGHRNFDEIANSANIDKAFKGCIQKVIINDRPLKLLEEYIDGVNIENCEHPCLAQPCLNGGRCIAIRELYKCSCPLGFESTNCEQSYKHVSNSFNEEANEVINIPMFSGDSFLMYDDPLIMQQLKGVKNDIELRIKATGPNGLLLWCGEEDMGASSDYLAIGLVNGSPVLRYNLGSGEVEIPYNSTRIDDGRWHKVRVKRYQRAGSLEVDGGEIVEGTSPEGLQQLNVANRVFLGGMHIDDIAQNTLKKFTTGFDGCISDFTVAAKQRVNLMQDVEDGENIHECTLGRNKG